jgi:hypothetical protein
MADRTEVVELAAEAHNVYFWVVPANASGVWEGAWTEGARSFPFVLTMEQRFQVASGRMTFGDRELALTDVIINGDRIRFSVETESAGRRRPIGVFPCAPRLVSGPAPCPRVSRGPWPSVPTCGIRWPPRGWP